MTGFTFKGLQIGVCSTVLAHVYWWAMRYVLGSRVRVRGRISDIAKPMFWAAGLILATALTGCAAPSSYMGIDLASTPASAGQLSVQTLAQRAKAGDKHAQLELGVRFEEVCGKVSTPTDKLTLSRVACDLEKAKKLYAKAARDSGGTIWVYSPPVGNGTKGRTIPVSTGPKQVGLVEAKNRLKRLE